MKIESKYSDFYDCIQAYGIDKSLTFHRVLKIYNFIDIRAQKTWNNRFIRPFTRVHDLNKFQTLEICVALIGFCGKYFPLIIVNSIDIKTKRISKREFFYNTSDYIKMYPFVEKFFRIRIKSKEQESFQTICEFFDYWAPDYWEKNSNPYFILMHDFLSNELILIENPILADYNFQKMKTPEETFQEIQQYLTHKKNINKPEVRKLSDKVSLQKAGFNNKSFKSVSPGKKAKRRNYHK